MIEKTKKLGRGELAQISIDENLSQKDENIVFENKRCDKLLFVI
jgi:hypothetical protein